MTSTRTSTLLLLGAVLAALAVPPGAGAATSGVAAWGDNESGQLGDGTTFNSDAPVAVSGLGNVTALAGGEDHSLALLSNGTVMAWGDNASGQLGNATTTSSSLPVAVSSLSGVIAIAAGSEDSFALLANGTVMAWGNNTKGQLGDGTINDSDVPVSVAVLSGVTAIAAGGNHAMALLSNKTVESWGENTYGQVGNGAIDNGEVSPVPVTGLTAVKAISAGGDHSLALLEGGTVKSWGLNNDGQLGNGTSTNSSVPVAVSGLSGVSSVAAGSLHSLALLSTGAVSAWGGNAKGQLGDGATSNSEVPVSVTGITTATAVAAGGQHSAALLKNETVLDWGQNLDGQLGDGSTSASSTPVAVSGLAAVKLIAAGALHTLAAGPEVTTVTSVSPAFGSASGGTSVTITGLDLTGATAVHFGSTPATSVLVKSSTSVTAVSPAGSGLVDVTVTTPLGTSAIGDGDEFSYLPAVKSLTPDTGPQAGGTSVKIEGANFEDVTAVDFGANAAHYTVESPTVIKAVSPAGTGLVDVTVTTSGGVSTKSGADRFTYPGSPPEFGICLKARKGLIGGYSNSNCTTAGGNAFAWLAGPGAKPQITTKERSKGAIALEPGALVPVRCSDESSGGRFTGTKTVGELVLTFTHCELEEQPCSSPAAAPGVIETHPLEGVLGVIKTETRAVSNKLGLDIEPVSGTSFMEFACGATTQTWRGSVIVPVPTIQSLKSSTLKLKGTAGVQEVESFERQPKAILESSVAGGGFAQSALSLQTKLATKEKLEANPIA